MMLINNELQGRPEWLSIFNTRRFFEMHSTGQNSIYLAMQDEENASLQAVVHLTESDKDEFVSPFRGTYGGYEFSRIDMRFVEQVIHETESAALERGAKKITLVQAPSSHDFSSSACCFNALHRAGYHISGQELNHSVAVTEAPLMERINRANQKRWRKCEREGFVFAEEQDVEGFRKVYEVIRENRASNGIQISMSFEGLMEMHANFPGKVHFFSCSEQGKIAAGAICIAIRSDILYVFYWGDVTGYEQYSPVVYLAENLYSYAMGAGFKVLDIGTSTLHGVPNYGLIKFKEALGFQASLKLSFSKALA